VAGGDRAPDRVGDPVREERVFDGLMTAVLGCPWMMDDLTAFDRIAA
jgi:hypothetical protein